MKFNWDIDKHIVLVDLNNINDWEKQQIWIYLELGTSGLPDME
jgi:hypothetical protein